MVPHGPGGQMLRPAPVARAPSVRQRALAQERSYRSQGRAVERVAVRQRAAARPAPARTQIRQARAQERSYRSQGRAVERAADTRNRQQTIAKAQRQIRNRAYAQERYYRSQGADIDKRARQGTLPGQSGDRSRDLAKLMRGAPVNKSMLLAGGYDALLKRMNVPKAERRATGLAPAIWALDQVSRPIYGVAGGADAAVRGKGVGGIAKATGRGLALKDQKLFSDVLKDAGVKNKTVRAVAGFGLDVALDPTTYMTFGVSSLGGHALAAEARSAARSAGRAVQRDLAKKVAEGSLTKQAAKQAAKARAKDIERTVTERGVKAGQTEGPKGLTVQVAGAKHVRRAARAVGLKTTTPIAPVTRTTRHLHSAGRFLVPKAQLVQDTRKVARQMGSELHGGVRAPDLSKTQDALQEALRREARAEGEATSRRVAERANSLLDRLSDAEREDVIHAIETDKIGSLKGQAKTVGPPRLHPVRAVRSLKTRHDPDRLFEVAKQVRSDLRHLNRVGRRSGLLAGQVGKQGRTRVDTLLAAKATPVRSAAPVQAALKPALKERALARSKLAAATTPAQKKAAQKAVERTDMRVDNLRRQLKARTRAQRISGAARHGQRFTRQRRFGTQGEAKGFFPRTNAQDIEEGGFLRRMAAGLEKPDDVPRAERLAPNRPSAGTAERREFRKPRAELAKGTEKERDVASALTSDVRETLSRYGTSVARASAGRNLNTKLIQSGQKLPRNLSASDFAALGAAGKGVYRVRRGVLEKVSDHAHAIRASQTSSQKAGLARKAGEAEAEKTELLTRAQAAKGKQAEQLREAAALKGQEAERLRNSIGTGGGGQYAILDDAVVRHVRARTAVTDKAVAKGYDRAQAGFKSVALATPGYLVRNVLGDAFNAAVHENPFVLARNAVKGQKALNALGRYEKSLRTFERQLPKGKRTIKLTPEQAHALGTTKTEISAMQAALIAEKAGVIRQGRFLELVEEGGKRPRGTHAWQNVVKRVEDSVRMTTFMGSLQRGLKPREAAANASMIHFDYGALTDVEKTVLRRAMPFYTFTSRNIPLQAKGIAKHPGKYAAVQKAREEGRRETGLPEGYEEGLNPYEARQLGLPIRWGKKTYTLSSALPFTDLNDLAAVTQGPLKPAEQTVRRVGEMLSPFLKLAPELTYNQSLFYRDQIEKDSDPLTRAPQWAVALAKRSPDFAKATGMVPDYVPPDGGKTYGWGRKPDYFFRQGGPGPITPLLDLAGLGVKGGNARGMTKTQRILAAAGARTIEYKPSTAEVNKLYAEQDRLKKAAAKLNERAHPRDRTASGGPYKINAEHPTPEYTRITKKISDVEKRLDALKRVERPHGFVGGRPVAESQSKAVGPTRRIAPSARRIAPSARRIAPTQRRIAPR
jgi:hypothetical protein